MITSLLNLLLPPDSLRGVVWRGALSLFQTPKFVSALIWGAMKTAILVYGCHHLMHTQTNFGNGVKSGCYIAALGFLMYVSGCLFILTRRETPSGGIATGIVHFAFFTVQALCLIIVGYAAIYGHFTLSSITLSPGGPVAAFSNDPETCLYFSMVTWTTVGYGDYAPVAGGRMFAASEAMIGYVCMALFLATLIHIFQQLRAASSTTV